MTVSNGLFVAYFSMQDSILKQLSWLHMRTYLAQCIYAVRVQCEGVQVYASNGIFFSCFSEYT